MRFACTGAARVLTWRVCVCRCGCRSGPLYSGTPQRALDWPIASSVKAAMRLLSAAALS